MSWARDVWPSERARLMSGHMMPTEREAPTVATLDELESWLDDDLACEAAHKDPRNRECSGEVTHVFNACGSPKAVCENTAKHAVAVIAIPGSTCNYCLDACRDHWRIRPI